MNEESKTQKKGIPQNSTPQINPQTKAQSEYQLQQQQQFIPVIFVFPQANRYIKLNVNLNSRLIDLRPLFEQLLQLNFQGREIKFTINDSRKQCLSEYRQILEVFHQMEIIKSKENQISVDLIDYGA